jgi:hypothetical protein
VANRDAVSGRFLTRPEGSGRKPGSKNCPQLRMAEWRSRLGCLEPIGRRSSGVAHLPQEKFQTCFSALSGLELRPHASSFLQAPTYSRLAFYETAARQFTRYSVSAPRSTRTAPDVVTRSSPFGRS